MDTKVEATKEKEPIKKKKKSNIPMSIKVLEILFLINVALWVLFGLYGLFGAESINPGQASTIRINAVTMLVYAGIFLYIVWGINRRAKWSFYGAVIVLAITIIMTIFDEVGIVDIAVVIFNIVLFGYLIKNRNYFLLGKQKKQHEPLS